MDLARAVSRQIEVRASHDRNIYSQKCGRKWSPYRRWRGKECESGSPPLLYACSLRFILAADLHHLIKNHPLQRMCPQSQGNGCSDPQPTSSHSFWLNSLKVTNPDYHERNTNIKRFSTFGKLVNGLFGGEIGDGLLLRGWCQEGSFRSLLGVLRLCSWVKLSWGKGLPSDLECTI